MTITTTYTLQAYLDWADGPKWITIENKLKDRFAVENAAREYRANVTKRWMGIPGLLKIPPLRVLEVEATLLDWEV
jgi:hypothetical protein